MLDLNMESAKSLKEQLPPSSWREVYGLLTYLVEGGDTLREMLLVSLEWRIGQQLRQGAVVTGSLQPQPTPDCRELLNDLYNSVSHDADLGAAADNIALLAELAEETNTRFHEHTVVIPEDFIPSSLTRQRLVELYHRHIRNRIDNDLTQLEATWTAP